MFSSMVSNMDVIIWIREIRLSRHHAIPSSRFVVEHIDESASVRDVPSRLAEAIVTELTSHNAANIVEMFVQTLIVL